jgi:hypothetical protein
MGGEVILKSLRVIKEGGTIISLPTPEFSEEVHEQAAKHRINVIFVLVQSNAEYMNIPPAESMAIVVLLQPVIFYSNEDYKCG